MRIAIIGASKEAILLAKKLHELGHEIIALDDKRERIDEVRSQLDIATFVGDLRTVSVYDESRIHRADILIAAHEDESMNIIACVYARYKGVPKIIAVTNTVETANLLISLKLTNQVIIREEILARAIMDALLNIKSLELVKGLNIAVINVDDHRALVNQRIGDLERANLKVLAVVDESHHIIFPVPSSHVIRQGQKLVVMGRLRDLSRVLGVGL